MELGELKTTKWYMMKLPNGAVYPAKVRSLPCGGSGTPCVEWGVEGKRDAAQYCKDTSAAYVNCVDIIYELNTEQLGNQYQSVSKTCRVGGRFVENLRERVALCNELTRGRKMPLATYSRGVMQRLFENENRLDELIAETVSDLLNEQRDGE